MVKLPSISSSVLWNADAGKSCRRAEITSTGASFTNSCRSSKMSAQARKAIKDSLSKDVHLRQRLVSDVHLRQRS